jgi:hypothetical protein
MVTVVRRDKPENPNRRSRTFTSPQDRNIQPAEGPGRFQRGVDMIQNVFSDTGSNIADYMKASSDARDGRFFSAPSAYDADMAKFPINQGAGALEFFGDLFQLPFESGAQLLGYDQFGSGYGAGDTGYFLKDTFNIGDTRDLQDMYINKVLQDSPLSLDYAGLVQNEDFQNYLRGQGFNVTDDFDIYRDIVKSDDQATMDKFYSMSQDPESPYYTNINKFKAAEGMGPYNQALEDQYNQYLADEANKFMGNVYEGFAETQTPFMVDQLAKNLNVTPESAESILMGGGATNFGLLNDLMNYYEGPLEYGTPEGQALFGDDLVMNLAGGITALGKTGRVLKKAKNKLGTGRTAAMLEQLYPGTFGGRLEFPYRFGKDSARLNIGLLPNYPKTSGLIRTPAQLGLTMVAPDLKDDVVDFFSGE